MSGRTFCLSIMHAQDAQTFGFDVCCLFGDGCEVVGDAK